MTNEERSEYNALRQEMTEAETSLDRDKQNDIPDAPFEKNWHELAMKRMLRYAAENGYDKIAWTKGEQQAERYNLGSKIKFIEVLNDVNEGKKVFLRHADDGQTEFYVDENGNIEDVNTRLQIENGTKLSDLVGKDLAVQIMSYNDYDTKRFDSKDLRIGGEGMKGFYDEMLPRFMNKYGKKWGAKVGEVELPELKDTYLENGYTKIKSLTMHSVDVTPEMKESVMQGQPMFSVGDAEAGRRDYERALEKWKADNGLPADAVAPTEADKPQHQRGEDLIEYARKLTDYSTRKALWATAPRESDYPEKRKEKAIIAQAVAEAQRYPESLGAKMNVMAAELSRLRKAVSRQRQYDRATVKAVTDFAQEFLQQGFGDNLGRGEIKRLLSSVKNATGKRNIREDLDKILNLLVDHHLRNLQNTIGKITSIREVSKTAQGVEKQGRLDLKGQKMLQTFRDTIGSRMTEEEINERILEVEEHLDNDPDNMWAQEWEGLDIARQYVSDIDGSRKEWEELKKSYDEAKRDYQESGRSYQQQQELLASIEESMHENKLERIALYGNVIDRLSGRITDSIEGAKEFREREKERVNNIHHLANLDLQGKDSGAFHENDTAKRFANMSVPRFFLGSLSTFEQMLRQFGGRNANGAGYLYNHFMRGWLESTNNAFLGEKKAKEELDAKAREVFGKKVKRWSDLYALERKLPTMDVEIFDRGTKKTLTLTQGNLLYIVMADKMTDGRMKLRDMGITEENVEAIRDHLDPRLLSLGDWLQDEYLVNKRNDYNKVHVRMFGAPMAAIENYFPLKILSDARVQEQDVANPTDGDAILPSTITGSIIKRRRNTLPLDILNTDALSLAIEHIEDMEHWAAQAEWNRDVNTLLSYTTFRNKVKNLNTIYGSGEQLWNTFKDAARIAAGSYTPKAKPGSLDAVFSNMAKGVTAAKISFRPYTAFKQILSAPAFLHDSNMRYLAKYSANPMGSWQWAMENMPIFEKRWKSRQVGDTRLMEDATDWKLWKTNVVQLASRLGMSPNAFVDGITCAVGARSIYETRLHRYRKYGYAEEIAKKLALQDAEVAYNLTQQSSEGAFVSAIQKDKTVLANMLTVFRNSSMAYTRQWVDASRNLKHRMQSGYRDDSIAFMTRQIMEEAGLAEEDARKAAEMEYNRAGRRDIARLLNMMFGVTIAWNLGASLPYLLIGDDDETKKEMLTDAFLRGMVAGSTEGFVSGNIFSEFVGRATSETTRKAYKEGGFDAAFDEGLKQMSGYEINPLPLMADVESMINHLGYDKFAAAQDVFNICAQCAVGVNPQTFTDMWNACMDYAAPGWDGTDYGFDATNMSHAKEIALFLIRITNAPTSSWRNKYIDELGMTVGEAKEASYDALAKRYAHYKHWKDAPVMGWFRSEGGREEKMEKIRKQFEKAVTERVNRISTDALADALDNSDSMEERRMYAKEIARRLGVTSGSVDAAKAKTEWQDRYQRLMEYKDVVGDEQLSIKKKEAKQNNNKAELARITDLQKRINELKKRLGEPHEDDAADAEIMRQIRELRDGNDQ